ncbi:hypothetical protein [Kribbella turkmenica]|uniref:hypothetical protein n=1 Tax=Kribbella turkmenica TaxID=2530375 RepID=UPI00192D9464|nr:hypothetical protein [Kribbella turkmenica]
MRDITGDFEIHLTTTRSGVIVDRTGGELRMTTWASDDVAASVASHGLKFSDIVLDRGRSPQQPMVTVRASGTLEEVGRVSREWSDRMQAEHFSVVRIKIEAAPWNDGVPEQDADAVESRYFEHHVNLLLPDAAAGTLVSLTRLLEPHQARLFGTPADSATAGTSGSPLSAVTGPGGTRPRHGSIACWLRCAATRSWRSKRNTSSSTAC